MLIRRLTTAAATLIAIVLSVVVHAQDLSEVQIKTIKVADGIYMLEGRGGNIGLSVDSDGVFMIDDQFAPLSEKITAAIAKLSDQNVKFLINTHWHGDHTGGNENFGKAGAVIVAHENVRTRMSTEQFSEVFNRTTPPSPKEALPVITFAEDVTFHWNSEEMHIFHVGPAHTDGDSIIHFKNANVFHMGDIYFNGLYPFIDPASGGTIDGVIETVDLVLPMMNDKTKLIPGHGDLSNAAELREYRSMLVTVRDRIHKLMDEGKSLEEVVAAKPSAEFDGEWGTGFLNPDQWVGIVYEGMKRNSK